jgi:hypothetical protein
MPNSAVIHHGEREGGLPWLLQLCLWVMVNGRRYQTAANSGMIEATLLLHPADGIGASRTRATRLFRAFLAANHHSSDRICRQMIARRGGLADRVPLSQVIRVKKTPRGKPQFNIFANNIRGSWKDCLS